MTIQFLTKTLLSHLDLTIMGGSDKREDDTKIGKFSTGFKNSIAILLRNNIEINIGVYKECTSDYNSQSVLCEYTFNTKKISDDFTGKSKEIIIIDWKETMCGNNRTEPWGNGEKGVIETGYSIDLGFDWPLYKAFTEIASNCIDEKGEWFVSSNYSSDTHGTIITLNFPDDSEFADIINDQDKYVLNEKYLKYDLGQGVKIYENPSNHLKIYKQGILIHEDLEQISKYCFNIAFGEIDERRLLKDTWSAGSKIYDVIRSTKNTDFLKEIITCEPYFENEDWLNQFTEWYESSELINNIATDLYETCGEVYTINGLMKGIQKRKDCSIPGKILKTIGDSVYSYNKDVVIKSSVYPVTFKDCQVKSVNELIEEQYNFKIDVDTKKANLEGAKVIMDRYQNCLILAEDFKVEEDFPEFLVQYYQLKEKGNVVEILSRELSKMLKK